MFLSSVSCALKLLLSQLVNSVSFNIPSSCARNVCRHQRGLGQRLYKRGTPHHINGSLQSRLVLVFSPLMLNWKAVVKQGTCVTAKRHVRY